jgi:tRNA A37 methylthiotransferase MiaB
VGFPGESDACFAETLTAARQVGFLHIHAFPFSPRESTAAARWKKQFVHQQTVTNRMHELEQLSIEQSLTFRQQFVGQTVELLVEQPGSTDTDTPLEPSPATIRHGRCERYFSVHFDMPPIAHDPTGQLMRVRITRVTPHRTLGEIWND